MGISQDSKIQSPLRNYNSGLQKPATKREHQLSCSACGLSYYWEKQKAGHKSINSYVLRYSNYHSRTQHILFWCCHDVSPEACEWLAALVCYFRSFLVMSLYFQTTANSTYLYWKCSTSEQLLFHLFFTKHLRFVILSHSKIFLWVWLFRKTEEKWCSIWVEYWCNPITVRHICTTPARLSQVKPA